MKVNKKLADFENRKVDLTKRQDREFITRQKNEYAKDRNQSAAEANESERALCSQLMLVTTVLLTANVFILGDSSLLKSMATIQKVLVMLGMVALSSSILTGIKYYFELKKFYTDRADAKDSLVQSFGDIDFDTFTEARTKVESTLKPLPKHVDEKWLIRQVQLLVLAFGVYVLLVIAIFFNASPSNQKDCYKHYTKLYPSSASKSLYY
jgi:hypothetical protein